MTTPTSSSFHRRPFPFLAKVEDPVGAALGKGMDAIVEMTAALPLHVDAEEPPGLGGPRLAGVESTSTNRQT